MRIIKRIVIFFISVILLSTTLFIGGCTMKEKITEQASLEAVTDCYNQIMKKVEEEGFVWDKEEGVAPPLEFDEDARRSSVEPYFHSENLEISIYIEQELLQKYVYLGFEIRTNKEILIQNEVVDEVRKALKILNSVSARQYTDNEIVELLTNDKRLRKLQFDSEDEYRYRAFNFWCDFEMMYWVYKDFAVEDKNYSATHKYKLFIRSKTEDIC